MTTHIRHKAGIKPDPYIDFVEWANTNFRLTKESSVEPGKYRTSRTPWAEEILKELSPQSQTQEIIVIEADSELYHFNDDWHKEIIEKYKTINKSVGGEYLWGQDQINGKGIMQRKDIPECQNGQKKISKRISANPLLQQGEQQHQNGHQAQTQSRSKAW